ncbi:unnamed protein product [Durusdinium trenchii]|uniref:Uncharacterized protein n=1 Tax=Durusdinium trenchii TaxID=1381693 RepID=A0ABP0QF05_9DINO
MSPTDRASVRQILATEGVLGLGLALRDEALRPQLALQALGECPSVRCATQRLARPEVRQAFLDFAVCMVETMPAPLKVLALGSGHLLFELELLEALRHRLCLSFSVIHLVDPLYVEECEQLKGRQHRRHALEAVEAFKSWFDDTLVATYRSVDQFNQAQDDSMLDLVLQLDAEALDYDKEVKPLLACHLAPEGRFLRLSGCCGHEDGHFNAGRSLFKRLLDASVEGLCEGGCGCTSWQRAFQAPELPATRRRYLERFVHLPQESRVSGQLCLFRVTAEKVPKGVVVIRNAPRLDGQLVGLKRQGELVIVDHQDRHHCK